MTTMQCDPLMSIILFLQSMVLPLNLLQLQVFLLTRLVTFELYVKAFAQILNKK